MRYHRLDVTTAKKTQGDLQVLISYDTAKCVLEYYEKLK
jgi:hypothetical protein